MSLFLVSIIVILLIICLILAILLLRKEKKRENLPIFIDKIEEKQKDITKLRFPKKIEDMGHHILFQACVKVFESFKALEYYKKNEHILNNYEWHSWQVSLLLILIKNDQDFFIPNPKKIFHEQILHKSLTIIKNDFDNILQKYDENVNIYKTRDELSKDLIWTVKEVSIIFYYMLYIRKLTNTDS